MVSFLRPLCLRLFITLLPLDVIIRRRNPSRRLALSFVGVVRCFFISFPYLIIDKKPRVSFKIIT